MQPCSLAKCSSSKLPLTTSCGGQFLGIHHMTCTKNICKEKLLRTRRMGSNMSLTLPKTGTPPMAGHGCPWPAMAGHGWAWHAMTSHFRPFPGMVGHGWLRPLMLGHCQPWRAMSINGWPRPAGNRQPWPAMVVPCTSSHAALQISMGTLFGITLTIAFRTVHLTINSRLKRLLRIFFAFSA